MATDRPTLPLTKFFSTLFGNLPRLIAANLLFAAPLAVFTALFWGLSVIPGIPHVAAVLIRLAVIIPVFPFYAGVVQVTAHISRGMKLPVASDFLAAVRENFPRFLVHGLVMFAALIFSYLSISFYSRFISQNPVFIMPLIVSVIVSAFFLFMFFYIPPMTVTFDISLPSIYKNSFLMSFGELKKNLAALLGLFLLFVFSSTLLIACFGNVIAITVVSVLLAVLLIPSLTAFIINSAVYERMYAMVVDNSAQMAEVEAKIELQKQKLDPNRRKKPDSDKIKEELKDKLEKLDIDENGDGDEYVFFEGRMMKRSVLIKLKNEIRESELD